MKYTQRKVYKYLCTILKNGNRALMYPLSAWERQHHRTIPLRFFCFFPHSHPPSATQRKRPILKLITLFLFCLTRPTCLVSPKKYVITCYLVSNFMLIETNGLDTCSSFFQTCIFTLPPCCPI